MTRFGSETDVQVLDEHGSTEEVISTIHDFKTKKQLKRYCIRIRVADKQQEMSEFIKFTQTIDAKRAAGTLITRDPLNQPKFSLEFPDFIGDGSYFVIRSYTEIVI